MVTGTLAVDECAVIFGKWQYSDEGPGRAAAPPNPLIIVSNVIAKG